MELAMPGGKNWVDHVVGNYPTGTTKVEVDGRLLSAEVGRKTKEQLERCGFSLSFAGCNLVD
jgi:hypothetical protein